MLRVFVLALGALFSIAGAAQGLPRIQLSAGLHLIHAEVADTFVSRMQGLMHRETMGQNDGMLFIFEEPGIQCMWMKNTLIPLSVAYIADDGSIVNIEEMKPQTEDAHCTRKPVRFALEMNRGWFSSKGMGPGTKLRGLDKLRLPR